LNIKVNVNYNLIWKDAVHTPQTTHNLLLETHIS